MSMPMPIAVTKFGLKIGNFSSPHPFEFDDGTILPACEPDRVKAGSLNVHEEETENENSSGKKWTDLTIEFKLSPSVAELLREAVELYETGMVDVVIVPLPVLTACKGDISNRCFVPRQSPEAWEASMGFIRTVRVKDRTTKVVWSDKFCK